MKERDYEHLEGKIIDYGPNRERAKVVGCDYDIGISIMYEDGDYAFCLKGPSVSSYEKIEKKFYPACFFSTVREIQTGYLKLSKTRRLVNLYLHKAESRLSLRDCNSPTAESCPFGQ